MFLLTEYGHFLVNYGYALGSHDNRDLPISQIQAGYLPVESPTAPSAPMTPKSSPATTETEWERLSRHDPLTHPLFGTSPVERVARGDPGLMMMLGPLIEQLGVALGGGVVQALD